MQATAASLPSALPKPAAQSLHEALGVAPRSEGARRDSRGYMLRRLLVLADVLGLCLAFALVSLIGGPDGTNDPPLANDILLLGLSVPAWLLLAYGFGLYHVDSRRADYGMAEELGPIVQMTTLWSWSVLLVVSIAHVRPVEIEKLALFWLLTVVALCIGRAAVRAVARRQTWYLQNALVMGTTAQTAPIVKRFLRHPEYGINVVAVVDAYESRERRKGTRYLEHVPVIRGDVDVPELVEQLDVDRVVLASSVHDGASRADVLSRLAQLDVHVDLIPSWSDVVGGRLDLHEIEGLPLLTVPCARLGRSSLILKRAVDLVGGSLILLMLAPILAACAAAIRLDSRGPVLFRQRRIGRDGKPFEVFKFRTMYQDAEARKEAVAAMSFHGGGNDSGMFKIRDDPRVTRVGKLLRRSSIDELPQLFNVLRGEMSLVGPRPLIENEARQVEGRFKRRVSLTPGLTGLWQVHGRSEIPFDEMVNLDYLYVTNWSLWGDLKLLMKTVSAVTRGSGAY